MKLEHIVLNGFKSFADKTQINFDSSITAIVGPNGCGKSNIVDAVKWVLGEQSVKSLRSGQMADVIFSGSSSRKSSGTAEVVLFISNTSGKLPIEADEVQISRRIYKSGESEYRINSKICRLKDIRELFMDTGVGARAYSIIEQGQVEQMLTSSKTERRAIFEEAAGISKYKAHKKEAIRKLERTDQNLLRLADILAEVQKQLRSVKLQAGKARNYLQYSSRLKELQVNYSLVEYHKLNKEGEKKQATLKQLEDKFAESVAKIAKNETLISNLGSQIIETENEVNQTDNSLVSLKSKIEQQFQQIEFCKTRIAELQERKETAGQRTEKIYEQKKLYESDLQSYIAEHEECEKTLEEKKHICEQIELKLAQVNSECNRFAAELDDEKSGIIDMVRRTAQLHNEAQSISVHRTNLSNQKERLSGRAETARTELEKILTEKAQLKARAEDIAKILEQLHHDLNEKREQAEQVETQTTQANEQLLQCREKKTAIVSELTILKDLEEKREGLNDAVKTILQASTHNGEFDYVEGILADAVVPKAEFTAAVEAALQGKADALIVNNTTQLLAHKEQIQKLGGRVNFLCNDKIEPFKDDTDLSKYPFVKGRLVEFVEYKNKYACLVWKLLGKTIVVNSMEKAFELSELLPRDYSFVTPQGHYLNSSGMIELGTLTKTTGLISRKSRVRQLTEALTAGDENLTQSQQQIENLRQKKEYLARLCKDLRTAVYEASTEKTQLVSKLSAVEENVKRLTDEQPLITGEIDLLEEQIAQTVQKEYNSKQKLQELEIINRQRTVHIEELQAEYSERKKLLEAESDQLTSLKVSIGQISGKSNALKQTIITLRNQIQQNRDSAETLETEKLNCGSQIELAERDILISEAAVSELFVDKEKTQQNSRSLHDQIAKLLTEQQQTEQILREQRTEERGLDEEINQLKIGLGQLEVKEQALTERVQDELQLDLAKSYEDFKGDENVDWDVVKDEITELRGKIERLGNVNIDAIDEQEELEKRNEFLAAQVEDLQKSQDQLHQLIKKLNKQSREKFREAFEEIRGHFQQLFRKLFGGGKADILLEDSQDILEAGIEIIARPPGKEMMSISLLSGGEKTMTAIALLFAIFKTRPSPFCLLDEVDAALDEANNERFNLLVDEFRKDSQFIIITHSKRTMSIADVLYGITMQTRGVSKKISVRFTDHDQQPQQTAAVA